MKTVKNFYKNLIPSPAILVNCDSDNILYFDIETTGLSKIKNQIYLIGCGYYKDGGLNIIQWFAESEAEELSVLKAFTDFSSSFSTLVNYNGQTFDIPFTSARLNKFGMNMPEFDSIDIYTMVKPLKKFLSLNDITQKSVESFLDINRNDKYSGGELISVYKKYCNSSVSVMPYFMSYKDNFTSNESRLNALLLHNMEDVLNMHYITEITEYAQLFDSIPEYIHSEINEYFDYNNNAKREMIIKGKYNDFPNIKSFRSFYNNETGSYILNISNDGDITIRIPINKGSYKCFISNYKDYYYLPSEDICIMKSMGGGVSKENRENARKDTCYVKCDSEYIPINIKNCDNKESKLMNVHRFKSEYKSKCEFIRIEDFNNLDSLGKTEYLLAIIQSFK